MVSYLTLSLLSKEFVRVVNSHCCYTLLWLNTCDFIDVDIRIKGIQIGNHEIQIVNFADDTTIFLRDFRWLTDIKSILKLCKKASSSKINFSKNQTLWTWAYKNALVTILHQNSWSVFWYFCPWLQELGQNIWQFNKENSN